MAKKKKSTSFRLSEQVAKQLETLAKHKHMNLTQALELAIREMAPSTPEQRTNLVVAREKGFKRITQKLSLENVKRDDAWAIFKAGYNVGWWHYQFRHSALDYEQLKLEEMLDIKALGNLYSPHDPEP